MRGMLSRRPRWFLRDPGGIMIACFAWGVMIACMFAMWVSVANWLDTSSFFGVIHVLWIFGLFSTCLWTHAMIVTTNPGAIPKEIHVENAMKSTIQIDDDEEDSDDAYEIEEVEITMPLHEYEEKAHDGSLLLFCDECNIYRPSRATHCDTCESCIMLHDHHCPWINNCVGFGNQKLFLLLLLYVALTSIYGLMLMCMQYFSCEGNKCGFQTDMMPGKIGVWILAACCIFGSFCSIMLSLELYNIYTDPMFTAISEQINSQHGSKSKSILERHLSVVCGTNGFRYSWFLPFNEPRTRQDLEAVYGYRCSYLSKI